MKARTNNRFLIIFITVKNWEIQIKSFINYLKIERGLAENSIFAYQSDIEKLKDFCIPRNIDPKNVSLQDLKEFRTFNKISSFKDGSRHKDGVTMCVSVDSIFTQRCYL